jgi:hypothetical protein
MEERSVEHFDAHDDDLDDESIGHRVAGSAGSPAPMDVEDESENTPQDPQQARRAKMFTRFIWLVLLSLSSIITLSAMFVPWSCIQDPLSKICIGPLPQEFYTYITPTISATTRMAIQNLCSNDSIIIITGMTVSACFLSFSVALYLLQRCARTCRILGLTPILAATAFSFLGTFVAVFMWTFEGGCSQRVIDYVKQNLEEQGRWRDGYLSRQLYGGFFLALVGCCCILMSIVVTIMQGREIDLSVEEQDLQEDEFALLRNALSSIMPNNTALI